MGSLPRREDVARLEVQLESLNRESATKQQVMKAHSTLHCPVALCHITASQHISVFTTQCNGSHFKPLCYPRPTYNPYLPQMLEKTERQLTELRGKYDSCPKPNTLQRFPTLSYHTQLPHSEKHCTKCVLITHVHTY